MESYQPLYRIVIEHDYFDGGVCTALSLSLTPQGLQLARRRSLLFRQTAMNVWTLLYDCAGAGPDMENDVLELALNITDPLFTLYTESAGFSSKDTYVLELPEEEPVIRSSAEKRKVGTPFCTVRLRLTEELLEAAKVNNPKQAVLHFHAPEVYWEYLFLSRSGEKVPLSELSLEDITGKLGFCAFEEYDIFGTTAARTISKECIPLREKSGVSLRLVALKGERRQRNILLSQVPFPNLGRFQSGQSRIIRQVCYY